MMVFLQNSTKNIGISARQMQLSLPSDFESVLQYLQDGKGSYSARVHFVNNVIHSKDTEDSTLLSWVKEFKDNILFFDKNNESIIFGLLKLKWYIKKEKFVSSFQDFALNLVTAHPVYLRNVFLMFMQIFSSISDDKETFSPDDEKSLRHVHILSERIFHLIPLSQALFCTLLRDKFPYIKSNPCVVLHYVENLLVVCTYIPNKRPTILAIIIEKLLEIDVMCSKQTIQLYEEQQQDRMEEDKESVESCDKMILPLAHTLDILMNSLFQFIDKVCFNADKTVLNWDFCKKLYKEMLTIFDKLMLPTHGSSHVQYLLFYMCSLKSDLCDGFLDYLWKKVQNPSVGPVLRQMAAFYIGSFLARAQYASISTVTACFDLMCSWIHRYIDTHTSQDLDIHGTFHSVCQTVFYVFAFRNKELMEMPKAHKYLCSLQLDRMASCRLNPLRFVDAGIVQNFASVARAQQIAYVYPILERNNRNLLRAHASEAAGAIIPTFFPFDPYLLKRSKSRIESLYRVYQHTSKDDEFMDATEENCEDLFSYSSSPGFKKSFNLYRART